MSDPNAQSTAVDNALDIITEQYFKNSHKESFKLTPESIRDAIEVGGSNFKKKGELL